MSIKIVSRVRGTPIRLNYWNTNKISEVVLEKPDTAFDHKNPRVQVVNMSAHTTLKVSKFGRDLVDSPRENLDQLD